MEPAEGVIIKNEIIDPQVMEINENDSSITISSYDDDEINVFNEKPGTKRYYGLSDAGISFNNLLTCIKNMRLSSHGLL